MLKFVSLIAGLGMFLAGCAHAPKVPNACTPPPESVPTDDGPAAAVQCQWPGGGAALCVYGTRVKQGPDIRLCAYLYARESCAAPWVLAKVVCKGESTLDETP
jgi:hypothetical protein